MKQNKLPSQKNPTITPEHLRRRAVVYCRQNGVDQNAGIMAYQRSLAKIARSYGWTDTLIEVIDEDCGKSGLSKIERRGFQRLEEMIDADQVAAVFVSGLDRLSRDLLQLKLFRLRAALHNTLLYAAGRFIDLAGASDRIVSEIVSVRDRWFANQKAIAGKRHADISRRRSACAKKLPRSVRGQNNGRGKKR
jgi:DNA invertase Pin-like site-specific DNA recombinase